jgi:NCS1 family nucleobase:cation symporter-1
MIAVGLSWKMAIGACVLGNSIMGLVITVNGRMGATVGYLPLQTAELGLLGIASHSVPGSRTHALWLLLQLLRCAVPLRPRRRLARVSLSDQSLHQFRKLTVHSVQTTTGGQCMTVLLTAIWPSFANIPNHIPASQGITTAGMIGFLLYFLLQLPFLCIPYTKVWPCRQFPRVHEPN